jgi:hypothetical protein
VAWWLVAVVSKSLLKGQQGNGDEVKPREEYRESFNLAAGSIPWSLRADVRLLFIR